MGGFVAGISSTHSVRILWHRELLHALEALGYQRMAFILMAVAGCVHSGGEEFEGVVVVWGSFYRNFIRTVEMCIR